MVWIHFALLFGCIIYAAKLGGIGVGMAGGLGMAIAQSVVKAHHGFICASGSEGTGLTLTVVLPVAPVEPRPLTQASDERKGDKWGRRSKKQ